MATILVVDDDPELRAVISALLRELGHEPLEAGDGLQALEIVKWGEPPDVVLTDLMMPEKDGISLIQELQVHCPRIRIIAMSGGRGGKPAWLPMARTAGATELLKKPFTKDQLEQALATVLNDPWNA